MPFDECMAAYRILKILEAAAAAASRTETSAVPYITAFQEHAVTAMGSQIKDGIIKSNTDPGIPSDCKRLQWQAAGPI